MLVQPVLLSANIGGFGVLIGTTLLSFALVTGAFFLFKHHHERKNPSKEDIKETNRQRREREKLKRQTTEKVNAYMKGKKSSGEAENIPNGKRCGKYKKKNKKK